MPQANDSFKGKHLRSLITIEADENGKLPSEIKVLPVGEWQTEPYGLMQVTLNHVSQMVANFQAGVRRAVPVDVDHDGGKAAGWITDLIDKGNEGLFAMVEWTKYGQELLTDKIYKLFSPEWTFDYIDPEHGTRHGATLIAGSLTNRPLFKELPMLVASDGTGKNTKDLTNAKTFMILLADEENSSTTMNAEDIKKKLAEGQELTDEEKTFVKDSADFSDEEKAKVETPAENSENSEGEGEGEGDNSGEGEGAGEGENSEGDNSNTNTASENTITITADEHKRLLKADEEVKKAKEELRRNATDKEVTEKFVKASDGMRIIPAQKDALVTLVMKMSDADKNTLYTILASINPTKVEGEAGDSSNSHLTAKEQLDTLITEKIKVAKESGKTITRHQAMKEVISENPELVDKANSGQ